MKFHVHKHSCIKLTQTVLYCSFFWVFLHLLDGCLGKRKKPFTLLIGQERGGIFSDTQLPSRPPCTYESACLCGTQKKDSDMVWYGRRHAVLMVPDVLRFRHEGAETAGMVEAC